MNKAFSTERICFFTDAVYAIVITLLVLELKAPEVPGMTDEQLLVDLAKQHTSFIAYFISFFISSNLLDKIIQSRDVVGRKRIEEAGEKQ